MILKRLPSCILALCILLYSMGASALSVNSELTLEHARKIFPQADRIGNLLEIAPAYPVHGKDQILGYIALSNAFHPIPGYSGKPIVILLGLDLEANIKNALIHHHEEPILVAGIREQQLADFVAQYKGVNAYERVRVNASEREGYQSVDGISGATITVMIMNKTIVSTARDLAQAIGLPLDAAPRVAEPELVSGLLFGLALPELWWEKRGHVIFTGFMLLLLLAMLFFQDWLVVRTKTFRYMRVGFLLFTVFYLGYYHLAQLSIINILGFINVLISGFTWSTLMVDPIIFMIWGFIAISLLLWGRGVFCGWLCPFGAIQELLFKISEKTKLPKFEFPQMVHERLWAIKYFILILLVGCSLESISMAAKFAEVEPFKTVFVLRFQRDWYFLLFAGILLTLSLFNSKFYCKYLCPLGAALSFGSHFKVFDWLRRRKECGRPCQACASQCQISAIKPTGEIIDTECHYCLECQVLYWDEERCPPLVEKAARQKKRSKKPPEKMAQSQNSDPQVITVRPSNKERRK